MFFYTKYPDKTLIQIYFQVKHFVKKKYYDTEKHKIKVVFYYLEKSTIKNQMKYIIIFLMKILSTISYKSNKQMYPARAVNSSPQDWSLKVIRSLPDYGKAIDCQSYISLVNLYDQFDEVFSIFVKVLKDIDYDLNQVNQKISNIEQKYRYCREHSGTLLGRLQKVRQDFYLKDFDIDELNDSEMDEKDGYALGLDFNVTDYYYEDIINSIKDDPYNNRINLDIWSNVLSEDEQRELRKKISDPNAIYEKFVEDIKMEAANINNQYEGKGHSSLSYEQKPGEHKSYLQAYTSTMNSKFYKFQLLNDDINQQVASHYAPQIPKVPLNPTIGSYGESQILHVPPLDIQPTSMPSQRDLDIKPSAPTNSSSVNNNTQSQAPDTGGQAASGAPPSNRPVATNKEGKTFLELIREGGFKLKKVSDAKENKQPVDPLSDALRKRFNAIRRFSSSSSESTETDSWD